MVMLMMVMVMMVVEALLFYFDVEERAVCRARGVD
jgi:hypothetical protein